MVERRKDLTHDMVEALGQDMKDTPGFHAKSWAELKQTWPGYCDFIDRRLKQFLGDDAHTQGKFLALFVELKALESKAEFGASMSGLGVVPEAYADLGNFTPDEQLKLADSASALAATPIIESAA